MIIHLNLVFWDEVKLHFKKECIYVTMFKLISFKYLTIFLIFSIFVLVSKAR